MLLFGGVIEDELVPVWRRLEPTLSVAQRKSIDAGVGAFFTEVNDTIRAAAAIPRPDRHIEPEDLLRLCKNGFEALFGEVS